MRNLSSCSIRPVLVGFIVLVSLFATGCGGGEPPAKKPTPDASPATTGSTTGEATAFKDTVLKLGRIPFTNATGMVQKHEELLKYLTRELGVKETRLVLASSYNGIMDKLVSGEIDIGWLASISSVEARNHPKLQLLVKPIRFDTDAYRGIIICREDSGIRSLADLKGKRFAWVEKESASGYIFPRALLLEGGINPDQDFSETSFLNKHDAVVLNVLLGKYDAGACYDDARQTLRNQDKIDELTILATTQNISNEPIVCRKDLPKDLIDKIKKAFLKLDIKKPEYKKVLTDLTDVQGFVPTNDSDYDYIEKMLDLLKKGGK